MKTTLTKEDYKTVIDEILEHIVPEPSNEEEWNIQKDKLLEMKKRLLEDTFEPTREELEMIVGIMGDVCIPYPDTAAKKEQFLEWAMVRAIVLLIENELREEEEENELHN